MADDVWRAIARSDFGLTKVISDCIADAAPLLQGGSRSIRSAPALYLFSDYGGAHKSAQFEVISFLATSPLGISTFLPRRQQLRSDQLGTERRMAYKALGDAVRARCLPTYLDAADCVSGVLVNFCIDKNALHRLSEKQTPDTAFGEVGPWAPRAFRKLTTIGHLAGVLVEGLRADGQHLLWITDEDDIAPNPTKHAEATRILGHFLNSYSTGPMGHCRFATTASDPGDLSVEDLASLPDFAAGCLNDILTYLYSNAESPSIARIYLPTDGGVPAKARHIATWLARSDVPLAKLNIVIDERDGLCSVRRFTVVTDLAEL